jgi:hypothetical protein
MSTSAFRFFAGSTRRVVAFSAFGISGLALAATWAASVQATTPGTAVGGESAAIDVTLPTGTTPELESAIALGGDTSLPISFTGRWGNIPVDVVAGGADDPDTVASDTTAGDYELFEIDLTGIQDGVRDFFLELTLGNEPDDFTALQIEFVKVDLPCATADLDNTGADGYLNETLFIDKTDSTAVMDFQNASADVMCIGVADTDGAAAQNDTGTYIRRNADDTSTPNPMPTFTAILGEY